MAGIVVVSHSRALAGAAVELAMEMVHGQDVRIQIAAGLDEHTFGTDAVQIVAAIAAADRGDGVVVLMDLGSAVLSAELALDLLDDEARGRVLLCAAPLVEGLVVAAVAAAAGATAEEVAAEASGALAAKQSQLGPAPPGEALPAPEVVDPSHVATFVVANQHGLHARPAAALVQTVRGLDARVRLRNLTTGGSPVPAESLSKVATLGALRGHELEVSASGEQAGEALAQVLALAARGFGEQLDQPRAGSGAASPGPAGRAPVPVSPGLGIGPATPLRPALPALPEVPDAPTEDPAGERRALREATAAVRRELQQVRAATARDLGQAEAAIFEAHLLLLDDPQLLGVAHAGIDAGRSAGAAWAGAVAAARSELAELPDAYLSARAADVEAVGDQVLRSLLGTVRPDAQAEGVLICADLTPAEAAALDPARVSAVVLAYGSPTSHAAILIRSRGIPAVVAAGPAVLAVPPGTTVAVDGLSGEVVVDPPAGQLAALRERAGGLGRRAAQALAKAGAPAVTQDGVTVLVGANLGSTEDAVRAVAGGADLAGLVRTEFLFLDRTDAPGVEEQEAAYRAVAAALDGRRCTFRTLDAGGDKPLPYLRLPQEANPFLGVRGIRLSLRRPALLADQLLAVVRVAHDHPVDLMFPMISTLDELFAARSMVDDAVAVAGRGRPDGLRIGIMVEVPAAALKSARFAPYVDFFSIGTNDLTQYALAAERGNEALSVLADPLDPGVLRLVHAVCRGAGDSLVGVCGEAAADGVAAAVLIGLGVRELSVAPPAVPEVKQVVRSVDVGHAARLAAAALRAQGAGAVRSSMT